jgi:hypothetical protein
MHLEKQQPSPARKVSTWQLAKEQLSDVCSMSDHFDTTIQHLTALTAGLIMEMHHGMQ